MHRSFLALLIGAVAVSGCAAAPDVATTATITGNLVVVGGPAGAPPELVPGVVVGRGPHRAISAVATVRGRYVLQVAPGTYTVSGRSPLFDHGDPSPFGCSAARPVQAAVGQTAWADVFCVRR